MPIIVKEEIWQDKDGNPVPFGSEKGVSVLHGAGVEISEEEAKRAGIKPEKEKAKSKNEGATPEGAE
jgi:hypothetical protein